MTPAAVWANAWIREYQACQRMSFEAGYTLDETLSNGQTVKAWCHARAHELADTARHTFIAANPNWLEELEK